jgi:exonuclease VII small subunit
MFFSNHIHALENKYMELSDLVTFFEDGYALVQQLKADGTLAKLEAAEAAVLAEVKTNPSVQSLFTLAESYFTKKAAATAAQAPSGATS